MTIAIVWIRLLAISKQTFFYKMFLIFLGRLVSKIIIVVTQTY